MSAIHSSENGHVLDTVDKNGILGNHSTLQHGVVIHIQNIVMGCRIRINSSPPQNLSDQHIFRNRDDQVHVHRTNVDKRHHVVGVEIRAAKVKQPSSLWIVLRNDLEVLVHHALLVHPSQCQRPSVVPLLGNCFEVVDQITELDPHVAINTPNVLCLLAVVSNPHECVKRSERHIGIAVLVNGDENVLEAFILSSEKLHCGLITARRCNNKYIVDLLSIHHHPLLYVLSNHIPPPHIVLV